MERIDCKSGLRLCQRLVRDLNVGKFERNEGPVSLARLAVGVMVSDFETHNRDFEFSKVGSNARKIEI